MKVGDRINVEYHTGETFSGTIRNIRQMPQKVKVCDSDQGTRLLFTIFADNVGYRSMYRDSCNKFEIVS